MGFFFSNQKKAKAKNIQRSAKATQQNAEILNGLGCKVCPLNEAKVCTPKMQPSLVKETLIYFLRATPSLDEDEEGKQTPSDILSSTIPKGMKKYCSYDSIVRDYCEKPEWKEIECCRGLITKSIEQAKPVLIVGLGEQVLRWAVHEHDLDGLRGRIFAVKIGNHSCWFLPTYDDKFLVEHSFKKDKPLNSKFGHAFRMDVKKAFAFAQEAEPPVIWSEQFLKADIQCFNGSEGAEPVLVLLKQARNAPVVATDVETTGLRPYAVNSKILTVACSFGDIHFAFALDHPKAKWTKQQRDEILSSYLELLKAPNIKVAHNAPMEIEWAISVSDPTIVKHKVWECTQMQAHFINERRGEKRGEGDNSRVAYQSLDFLIKMHFGIAYKKFFKLNKKDMINADLDETLLYNGADSKVTLALWLKQTAILKKEGLWNAYRIALPRQPTVALMQHFGIDVDQSVIAEAQTKLGVEIKQLEDKIYGLRVVQDFIKDNGEFNWASDKDAVSIFKDYLKRDEIFITDKSGKKRISTDKNVLDRIDHPLADLIIQARNRSKLKSTYVDVFEQGKGAFIWPDGKIHTNFNTTFTETARLSSDYPNLQNFPKRSDSWIRQSIIPPKNHLIVAFDYGQLEACAAAMCSKDKVLVKALWEDYDIHMEWSERLAKEYPLILGNNSLDDKKFAKSFRSRIKNKLVFPAIFGAQDRSIAGYLGIPEEPINALMREFWRIFCGLREWQDGLIKEYYETGYVSSLIERRRHCPLTRNEAINAPIQSTACEIVVDSMNTLSIESMTTGEYHLHPILNLHDDLSFCIPNEDEILEDNIRRIYTTMLTPAFDFINVPLSVECSVGDNWYKLQEIGKFWSHKDIP
ncbi:MAG TPA: DNA polymerase [Candidatus Angelobacter sp.]|nr:DNA polymerase [Candidatus Angelobacter sp.]